MVLFSSIHQLLWDEKLAAKQRHDVGAAISITTLIACIAYLAWDWRKSRKAENSWDREWKPLKGAHGPSAGMPEHKHSGRFKDSFKSASETIRRKMKDFIAESRMYRYRGK